MISSLISPSFLGFGSCFFLTDNCTIAMWVHQQRATSKKKKKRKRGGGKGGGGSLPLPPSSAFFFPCVQFTVHLRFWTKMGAVGGLL